MDNPAADGQSYDQLHNNLAEYLLKENSPGAQIAELKPIIAEHKTLVERQSSIKKQESSIAAILPVIEKVDAGITQAEKQVASEKKELTSFAEELGRSIFAGFKAGELPNQPVFSQRLDLQSQIDDLQGQRSKLLNESKSTFLEKTKAQAQLLALAGRIKVAEFKVGSVDTALGMAVLESKENLQIQCQKTEQILKLIASQRQRVLVAIEKQKEAEHLGVTSKSECGTKLGRSDVNLVDLKNDLKILRSENAQITNRLGVLRSQVCNEAIRSKEAKNDPSLGLKIEQITKVQFRNEAKESIFNSITNDFKSTFKTLFLSKVKISLAAGSLISCLLLLFLISKAFRNNDEKVFSPKSDFLTEKSVVLENKYTAIKPGQTKNSVSTDNSKIQKNHQQKQIVNSIGMKLVLIPGGKFSMGSPPGEKGSNDSERQHEVTISKAYYLGVHEVTQGQYQKVMGNNPSYFQGDKIAERHPQTRRIVREVDSSNHPVEEVSWDDAVEFCRRLSELPDEKQMGRIYRLPTEAEWEYACRAGKQGVYHFGNDSAYLGDFDWFAENSKGHTHPVGGKKPNAWGFFDMHGNVSEWCHNWYEEYPRGPVTDPQGPTEGPAHTLRGGYYTSHPVACRAAHRTFVGVLSGGQKSPNQGFRIALTFSALNSKSEENNNSPSDVPNKDSEGNLSIPKNPFHYSLNGMSFEGTIEKVEGGDTPTDYIQFFPGKKDNIIILNDDMLELPLSVTDEQMNAGQTKADISLSLKCHIGNLLATRDQFDPNFSPHVSLTIEYQPDDSSKNGSKWFGVPASQFSLNNQKASLRSRNNNVVNFGDPEVLKLSGWMLYRTPSSQIQLALIRKHIEEPDLEFAIGSKTFLIGESARHGLFLFDRAIAMARYRKGIRNSSSRRSLDD